MSKRIFNWLKENKYLVTILLLAIILRIYYFLLTKSQPLWYDEVDYMSIAKSWAGVYYWPYSPIRPVFFPLFIRILFFLGLGETTARVFISLTSVISVFLIYKVGELFFNKRTGLYASFLLAIFWSFLFYSNRLLVDVPVAFFWLLTIYGFFFAYLKNKNWKYFILPGIFLGICFLVKYTSALLVLLIAIYLVVTERTKIYKNTGILVFYLASFITILPFLIWQKIKFGGFFAFYTIARGHVTRDHTIIASLIEQTKFAVKLLDPILLSGNYYLPIMGALLIFGAAYSLLYFVILPEKIFKKNSPNNKNFFIFLWGIGGLLFFAWIDYGYYMDERYYFIFYPAFLLIISSFLEKIHSFVVKRKKELVIVLIILLFFFLYTNISHADGTILGKSTSFIELRQAGDYINENTLPSDKSILACEGLAELTYYSSRSLALNSSCQNKSDLINNLHALNSTYVIMPMHFYLGVHRSEGHIEVVNFVFSNPTLFTRVQSFGPAVDQNGQIPLLTIWKVNNELLGA